jgi:pimeloyl-ACP methyl ester carboxylesterase
MTRLTWRAAAGGVTLLWVGACGASDQGVRSTGAVAPAPPFDRSAPALGEVDPPDASPAAWSTCSEQPDPWECADVTVPLDYRDLDGETITVALTRLPARLVSERIGSLVLNPGGPGGSGVSLAWGLASTFPDELLDRFDLVGFDPRGVGRSSAIDCGDPDRSAGAVLRTCALRSGDLLPYLGTQNAARDLDQIRDAVGDEQLTYVGFSYGTTLGAAYANLYPERVRALVLDGATDPAAGEYNVDGTVVSNFGSVPFYGAQDFYATATVFFELCDATRLCPAGPRTEASVDDLFNDVEDATVEYFDGWDRGGVRFGELSSVLISSMYSTDLWPPLALALADASEGDASMLAAMVSFLEAGYPRVKDEFDNLLVANTAIYCADFAGRRGRFEVVDCVDLPETNEPLAPVRAVDVETPIVVIGADGDPATPGYLAPLMAEALDDAVSIRWEGAGHTAFLNSSCVDALVIDYLVELKVPADRTRCSFTDGSNTDVARAEFVFDVLVSPQRWIDRVAAVLEGEGLDALVASCVATAMVEAASAEPEGVSDLLYTRFGVTPPGLLDRREAFEAECG